MQGPTAIKKEEVFAKMEQLLKRPLSVIEKDLLDLTMLRDVAFEMVAHEKMTAAPKIMTPGITPIGRG
jgi:hypothetical protein